MVMRICSRFKDEKNYNTNLSCDDDIRTCCFENRIFTFGETVSDVTCDESWPSCTTGTAGAVTSGLSNYELIWVIVACFLIFLVLLVIFYLIYRLMRQNRDDKDEVLPIKSPPKSDGEVMVINVTENSCEKSCEARVSTQESLSVRPGYGAEARASTQESLSVRPGYGAEIPTILLTSNVRGNSPMALRHKLKELIEHRDEDKLAAMVETIENFYQGQLSDDEMDEARGVLEVWQLEHALVERVESEEGEGVIVEIEAILKKIELSEYKSRISEGRLVEARSMITAVTNKQELVRELKLSVHSAIQESNTDVLEALVDTIRAKQLDKECESELILAQNMFEKICTNDRRMVESELSKAVELRKSAGLRRAIIRAEKSNYGADLTKELENAKLMVLELEEIEKSRNMQRLRITSAMKGGRIARMEKCIQDTKFSGFGEDLRKELDSLELALKRKYLQKRLKGNLNVAVTSLDLIKLRRAVNEATAAGFLKELGLELHQAHGLITKLERLELIKRAVLELNNTHIAEIKSYTAPPVEVHRVLMSLLIVLGEEAETVRDWFEIQVILIKTGKLSLKRRVQDFAPQDLTTAAAKRAAKLLSGISHENLQNISKAAKVFYLWTSAVVEDKLSNDTIMYTAADAFKSGPSRVSGEEC